MKLSGVELKERIFDRLDQSINFLNSIGCFSTKSFVDAWLSNPSLLLEAMDWSFDRDETDIKLFLTSLIGSFQYALILNGYDISKLSGLNNTLLWKDFIQKSLADSKIKKIFQNNIWRKPTLQFLNRTSNLQNFLYDYFGQKPIWAADLGCGLHISLPFLLTMGDRKVKIVKGFGIDLQPRDFNWARANIWPEKFYLKSVKLLKRAYRLSLKQTDRFPFFQTDLIDLDKILAENYKGKKLDFILTSFVRHQLEIGFEIQNKVISLIQNVLSEGGLWIDIGGELILEIINPSQGWPARVYEKKNGNLNFLTSPFTLRSTFDDVLWKNQ